MNATLSPQRVLSSSNERLRDDVAKYDGYSIIGEKDAEGAAKQLREAAAELLIDVRTDKLKYHRKGVEREL